MTSSSMLGVNAFPKRAAYAQNYWQRVHRSQFQFLLIWICVAAYIPVDFEGKSTGFELHVSQLREDAAEEYAQDLRESGEVDDGFLKVLTSNDTFISLSGRSDQEIAAARSVATAIARLSGAYLSDPQRGRWPQPNSC